jgi:NAD(P)-dependent dehydrogenase (short-subunit alcohol dehydrogenase family)
MADLTGKVALVAGATRGAGRGIAQELGASGATVYVTGRSTRQQRSEYDRAETIEDTADLINHAGGKAIAIAVDHLEASQVEALIQRIEHEQGRLDILVNDIWGAENLWEWDKPIWEHSLEKGLRVLELAINTHLITSHYALKLMIKHPGGLLVEVTDGTDEYNRTHYRSSTFYDLAKVSINRLGWSQAQELAKHDCMAVSITPGWLRSELMLEIFEVTESNWQEGTRKDPHFIISESTRYVGRAIAHLAADPDKARWNGQSLSSGQLAKVYGFTDLDGSQPDMIRYLLEVVDMNKPADPTGYR